MSINKESAKILSSNLLRFMNRNTDKETFNQFSALLFNELTYIFESDEVIGWFLDWAREEGSKKE
ncbi:hypothetical protein [Bacillus sp. 7884-1]|uniref:hypothetical protein n=1 Tax=Bacillus sp. 7884-1 TaxID=2021693 RepID=UPI000BA5AF1F|nr:hypothetical protein [Bacillus sp. 7884-1]PAE37594.1 hypothetical protein CHI06_20000 [Bacillus sp. 7884-1]